MADINVTPLVDVMLVLLIIFMITAPLLASGVPLDLPDSRATAIQQEPDQIIVSIDAKGLVYIDDEEVQPGGLGDRLAAVPRGPDDRTPLATVRADKSIEYGRVMAVLGELNVAGFTEITLVTDYSAETP
jgi:biopolymer transport protein TolR